MGGRGDWPAAAAPWLSNNFTAISATGWVARMAGVASHKLCSHARLKRGLESASKEFIAGGIKGDPGNDGWCCAAACSQLLEEITNCSFTLALPAALNHLYHRKLLPVI